MRTKLIGVTCVALLIVTGAVAASASAAKYQSGAPLTTTYVTGVNEGSHTFKAGSVPVVCEEAKSTGSYVDGASSIHFDPMSYAKCKIAGQAAEVQATFCDYTLGEPTGSGSPFTVKTISLNCIIGKPLTIVAKTAGCSITLESQTTSGTSTMTNNGFFVSISLNANISKIKYTSSGGICGTKGTREDGTYTGKTVYTAFKNSFHTEQVGIWVE